MFNNLFFRGCCVLVFVSGGSSSIAAAAEVTWSSLLLSKTNMNKIEPTLIEYILELYSKFLLQLLIFRVKCSLNFSTLFNQKLTSPRLLRLHSLMRRCLRRNSGRFGMCAANQFLPKHLVRKCAQDQNTRGRRIRIEEPWNFNKFRRLQIAVALWYRKE